MRLPQGWYQILDQLSVRLPHLSSAQLRGLSTWVLGSVLAGSACESRVVNALLPIGNQHTIRQRLREWLRDGKDKVSPCRTQLEVETCFEPLMRWLLSQWQGKELTLALDASLKGDQHACLCLSVLYRGSAIPVAWCILPANQEGAWLCHILRLVQYLEPAIPKRMRVLFMADRGLWSPHLWDSVRAQGWHPMVRVQNLATFQTETGLRGPMSRFVPGPGHAWVSRGQAFTKDRRKAVTLVVVWGEGYKEPWCILTDLPVDEVPVVAYGLRLWIEQGFRVLKSLGWGWNRIRRTDCTRISRYFLVLAVGTLWTLSTGTRAEDAQQADVPACRFRSATTVAAKIDRTISVFQRGLSYLRRQLNQGYLWKRLWLVPEPYPPLPPSLKLCVLHQTEPV